MVEVDSRAESYQARYSTARLRPFTTAASIPQTELLELMLGVYTVDRLVPRNKRGWRRRLELRFPVLSLDRWSAVRTALEELLASCMGDDVVLHLRHRKDGATHADARAQAFALEPPAPVAVGLLSDGLDSLCGAAHALSSDPGRFAFVSVLTNSRRKRRVADIRTNLKHVFGDRIEYRDLDVHIKGAPPKQERTQRSRTLLAVTAGITVAAGYGASQVEVYENGMGILNLPVPGLQMPHESSQVLHPRNLDLWRRAVEPLLGSIRVAYPNRWLTKTQLCQRLPATLRNSIRATSSCDSPQRRDAHADCGVCGSCTMRRIALQGAGLASHDLVYSSAPPAPSDFAASDVFPYHVDLLARALASKDPWPELVRLQPTLSSSVQGFDDPTERAHAVDATIQLLRRHVADVGALEDFPRAV